MKFDADPVPFEGEKDPFKNFPSEVFHERSASMVALLKDETFFTTFRDAMKENRKYFENKVVLDIGCGCGMLSMFAVQMGAKKVIGVDDSEIINDAKEVAKENDMDGVITFVRGKVDEIQLPENIKKVDVIISGWMGYSLFHECALNDVLYARNKWLKKGGLMFPNKVTLHMCGIEDKLYKESTIDWYSKDVYGFDLRAIREFALCDPVVTIVDPKRIVTSSTKIIEIDLNNYPLGELHINNKILMTCRRNDYVHALATYFTAEFPNVPMERGFSTSPKDVATHWMHTIFYLNNVFVVKDRETFTGNIDIKSERKDFLEIDFKIELDFKGELSEFHEKNTYKMI